MAERASIAVLIPTKDEEINLPHTLASVCEWAQQVFVLDSGSTDRTEEIARQYGATFVHHPWEGYARQKNWGLDNLPIETKWVFILDADEVITPALRDELIDIASRDDCVEDGFYVNRYLLFLGHRIKHCGYFPSWNVRFFRRGKARYEEREVHEHMIVDGKAGYLRGLMEHNDRRGLGHFIAKHNQYSSLEAKEIFKLQQDVAKGLIHYGFWDGPIGRRRWIKHRVWPRVPARSFVRWFYMYILKLGFLDGRAGFHLCLLLSIYEHQITLKLNELWNEHRELSQKHPPVPAAQPLPQPITAAPAAAPRRFALFRRGQSSNGQQDMDSQFRNRFGADTRDGVAWPYPKHIYIARLLWAIVWRTLWKLCWRRLPILRTIILRCFGAKLRHVAMSATTWIEMPWDLEIGSHCLFGPRTYLYNLGGLKMGDHCVVSQDAYICGGTHDYNDPTYPLIRKKITIGSYVWIAAGAFIHPGVTIGEGAVIAARAVVVRDVEPWTIVAGNPAVVVKHRKMRRVATQEQAPGDPHVVA